MIKEKNKINWKEWIEVFFNYTLSLFPKIKTLNRITLKLEKNFSFFIEKVFQFFNIAHYVSDFKLKQITARTACFIEEARKKGFHFEVLKSKFGWSNYFKMHTKDKTIYFEGLPVNKFSENFTNNKQKTKKILKKKGFPVPEGKSFWFFQKKKALKYAKELNFPLVIKPNFSSLSKGVSIEINNLANVKKSIDKALKHSPIFIIEKFIKNTSDFRIAIVSFEKIFCYQRIPAFIKGDGKHSVSELIEIENKNPQRSNKRTIETPFYKIKVTSETKKILKEQNLTFSSIPPKGKNINLHKKPFLKLGGVHIDKTDKIHPDNIKLFKKIAQKVKRPLIGIDFLVKDISVSYKKQECAIIEINNLPGIVGHHYPYQGKSRNVSKSILKALKKEG